MPLKTCKSGVDDEANKLLVFFCFLLDYTHAFIFIIHIANVSGHLDTLCAQQTTPPSGIQ